MRANERLLAKSLDADLKMAAKTADTVSSAMKDVSYTSKNLMYVAADTGLQGQAGYAAEEAFGGLGRECAQIGLDLNTVTNVAIMARVALEAGQSDFHNLPPVQLTSGQRSSVSSARASKTQVYVSGYGPVSADAAESIWLEQARVRRETEAATALATLNTLMSDATQAARLDNGGWDNTEQLLDDDPQTTATATTGTTRTGRTGGTTGTSASETGAVTGATTGIGGVIGGVIGGGTKVVIDNPNRDWSEATADGTVTGSTGTGHTSSTGGSGGSGGSGGGSWSGAGGTGGAGGAGGLLAGGAAVGGVAAGAIGLGRGGLGGIGGGIGGVGGIGGAGFGGAGVGGAGAAGGLNSAAFGVGPVGGAGGMGGAGIGASASARAAGAMGSTMLGGPVVNGQGGAAPGQTGAQAGGRGMMGAPMGGGAAGGSTSKSRRHGAGYLAPDIDIQDEARPVALGPAARAGSRDQLPLETPEPDTDDEW